MINPPCIGINMYKYFIAALLASGIALPVFAAADSGIDHMEPPNWWIGMAQREVQLMVHGAGIAELTPALAYPGVQISSVTRGANPNYLFVTLTIDPAATPGTLQLRFTSAARTLTYAYRLLARSAGSAQRKGFDSSDAIY